uniref:G protein-coupled receptor kinase n=1 Tax=Gouania willdenowi TaxID=441366 RepID=A0A8C5N7L1_GOUWI
MSQVTTELVGLDNLVANTAYLRAQQIDRKELRKQKISLALPRPARTSALRTSVGKEFESLCEEQPIGRKLFHQFLINTNIQYFTAVEFLEEVSTWNFVEDASKEQVKQRILNKFCQPDSTSFLFFLTGKAAETCLQLSDDFDEVKLEQIRDATREFLKGKPFTEYLSSPFFDRFLQWKEYENQRISDKYFYEFRTLGKGGFGEVCAVQVKFTGQMYACKKLDKRRLKKKRGERLALVEKHVLEKVNSLFIVNLRVVFYTAQIITGILHLHSIDIVYRDMKPENVLLDGRGHCRLSDLGLAVELPKGKMAGTTGYMAPEILKQESYRMSVDWWALGCSIYEMVAARLPFKDFREKVQNDEVTRRTLEDECKFLHGSFDALSKDLITRFLKKRIALRLGCGNEDPRSHMFFQNINLHRLEAGLVEPPWVPKENVVYAKDAGDFRSSSVVNDVVFNDKDETFFQEFSTGAVPIQWQKEMIESGVFEELNVSRMNESTLMSRMCGWGQLQFLITITSSVTHVQLQLNYDYGDQHFFQLQLKLQISFSPEIQLRLRFK